MNLKFALRTLLKTPSVTIIATLSLALGIGATSAIFSLFDQILLRPLPVTEPASLVNLSAPGPKPGSQSCNDAGNCDTVFSYMMFRDLEQSQNVFTGIGAHRLFGANLGYRGQTLSGQGLLVSGSYFDVLGLKPALGRLIGPGDDRAVGESPVVVLSHSYWRTRFDSNPAVINETMIINGQTMTVIGVAPQGFEGTTVGSRPQIYVPITMRGLMQPGFRGFERRNNYWVYLFARLKPGVSIDQARTSLNAQYHAIINDVEAALQQGMSEQTLTRFRAKQVLVADGRRGQSSIHEGATVPLLILLGVTGFVLLIACSNIANLLLARGAARTGEMAVRLSIGASRRHLITQLLTESCLLAALGGVVSIIVAKWTLDLVASLVPAEAQTTMQFAVDPRLVMFAALLTLATGILFGLFPALHSTRPDVLTALKGQTGQPAGARSAARFRNALATFQVALSMTLLISAGLFVKSLFNISRVDLGIKTDELITFQVAPSLNGYPSARSLQLFQRLEEEIAAQPGVVNVSASIVPLLAGSNSGNGVRVQGFQTGPDVDNNSRYNEIGAAYFKTIGVTMLAGREFTTADAAGAPKVAIVNEQFARKFNLGRDVVGKRMGLGGNTGDMDIEIIGLVRNVKYSDVKQEIPPVYYLPYRQNNNLVNMYFYVRTAREAEKMLSTIQPIVSRVDPNLPVEDLRTMTKQIQENVAVDRVVSILSGAFASLATLLAAVGLYGVLAYTVAQRTREFGVRMALGADSKRVRGMVFQQVAWMTGIGGIVGLAAAIGLGQAAQSLLFELKGYDPGVLVTSAVLLGLVAIGAGFIPARRASKVDPIRALRYE
jgi:predicted permease